MNYVTRVPEAGNYTFLSEFKCGIYNRCWKAINKVTNNIVIVRTIPKIDLVKHENKSKMANEITLLKNSCHPLISKFIELIDLPKEFHIIMTEPKGISLREYIDKNGILEEKLGQELVKKLFTIAQYLKSTLGLEYCAFSPDSIFVDEKGHLVNYFI
ncbi:hypothetical protein TVAG_253170 [Trichomonas vaginalis G3]|uniref:Protein kinase domain-containing protein n=1 Tax=Trichomonas vaginalis (strain ATCC PRA-98 / G3) TaxID=412133 RepID=A2EXH6_TRIV3|nr:protein serine/threonine kinase protein [Trichomonas vaginalis G3]EAY02666.1 hypothetical protein TVAG_253170 [Trichomonas vaginalis G3]KAI5550147.1 protein serine/threonine kinase protein [Trichomonas vaginalis G3]|eukprot:XP_001314889.1 hypothetical protein [Trichomonas vaginalis G3]